MERMERGAGSQDRRATPVAATRREDPRARANELLRTLEFGPIAPGATAPAEGPLVEKALEMNYAENSSTIGASCYDEPSYEERGSSAFVPRRLERKRRLPERDRGSAHEPHRSGPWQTGIKQ
jgi:hypothetical protein